MSEKVNARELYRWKRGMDDYNIKILSALNSIIDGLAALDEGDWDIITDSIGSSSTRIADRCDRIYSSDELVDIAYHFEAIRTLIFGDKINYSKLLDMLRENVDECGRTEEKERQRRKENYEKLEEKRRASKEKYGKFSNEMPERLKKQKDEFNRSEEGKELTQLLDENKNPSSDENTKEDNSAV